VRLCYDAHTEKRPDNFDSEYASFMGMLWDFSLDGIGLWKMDSHGATSLVIPKRGG